MKNIKFSRLFAAMMFVAVLSFAGCKQQPEEEKLPENVSVLSETDAIYGKWSNVDTSWNTYTGYGCNLLANKIETSSWGVHDTTVYIKKITETSGYLYYQFSEDVDGYDADWNQYTIEGSKGKWNAIAYKNLENNTVKMCDAAKDNIFASSLEEAVELYTIGKQYFSYLETSPWIKVTD